MLKLSNGAKAGRKRVKANERFLLLGIETLRKIF